jgi:CheY-like chemotaxis protein
MNAWLGGAGNGGRPGTAEPSRQSRAFPLRRTPHMPTLLNGIVVVVVEDDPDSRELLKMIMEQRGATVVAASDAVSALEALRRVRPNVLVTDVSMPGRDGLWLMQEALTHGLLNGVGAVALTAMSLTPQQIRDAGFDVHLLKPIDPAVLCARVHGLARRSTPRSA